MRRDLERAFPGLAESGYEITSPRTPEYNCIAWAAGDDERWWWPDWVSYWPEGSPREETLEAFVHAYAELGYTPCENGEWEEGFEKVAIYIGQDGRPTHAAKQLSSGRWSSKLGRDVDIEHGTVEGVCGGAYGSVGRWLRRRRS